MAAQVEGAHFVAVLRETIGEFPVARAVIFQTVNDHQHCTWLVRGRPPPLLVELESQRADERTFAVFDARRERDAWARADDEPGRGARHTETEEHRPAHVPTILWKW